MVTFIEIEIQKQHMSLMRVTIENPTLPRNVLFCTKIDPVTLNDILISK